MSRAISYVLGAVFSIVATLAAAQDLAWVQIEARPTEAQASERAVDYAGRLSNVNGFSLPSGWFAIAIGPYDTATAEAELRRLRATGAIPADSFISDGRGFGRRIFGSALFTPVEPATPLVTDTAQNPAPAPVPAEETLAQSRDAETLLSRSDRQDVQEALKWEGFYTSVIDASFGPGTRRAMADWQAAYGYEATGVLSTAQRLQLLESYREVLSSLGMQRVYDAEAGIEIELPTAMVAFGRYEPPFAHYDSVDNSGVRVLLISQTGDEATLAGLYDIMQSLEIVPLEGPRSLAPRSFTLTGANESIVSSTYAELTDGTIKGFTLIWPAGDEKRRSRALQAMQASFAPTGGALPDTAGSGGATQSPDLLAGLEIRRPERMRSGFYVDGAGRVLTSAEAVAGCGRVTVNGDIDTLPPVVDEGAGLALLTPASPIVPIAYARFQAGIPRIQSEVAVAGYPYGGALALPVLTFGTLADVRGLQGEANLARLALASTEGDTGGPVFDTSGAVVGVLMPRTSDTTRQLPPDVAFAADAATVATFLSDNGVAAAASDAGAGMAPEDLTTLAADVTVLVSCWN